MIGLLGGCYNQRMEPEKIYNKHDSPNLFTYRENWVSRDGRAVILRSITSADKRIEKELIDGLSGQSSHYRFFHVIKEATEEMINQFCDIDYKNEVAIIAEYNSNDKKRNVGVVRLFIDTSQQTGEFAVLVADNFQNSGLGTKFMKTLIEIGQKTGLKSIYGTVLAENNRMLTLAKEFNFDIGANSDGEVKITKQL
jgi:acetyltransferase